MKRKAPGDSRVDDRVGGYRVRAPSDALRARVLRAARATWSAAEADNAEVPWTGPVLRLAASVAVAILTVMATTFVQERALGRWPAFPAPPRRPAPAFPEGLGVPPPIMTVLASVRTRAVPDAIQQYQLRLREALRNTKGEV